MQHRIFGVKFILLVGAQVARKNLEILVEQKMILDCFEILQIL